MRKHCSTTLETLFPTCLYLPTVKNDHFFHGGESSHEFAITERDLSFQIDHHFYYLFFFFEENTVKVPFAVCTLMDEVIFVHFLTTISKI